MNPIFPPGVVVPPEAEKVMLDMRLSTIEGRAFGNFFDAYEKLIEFCSDNIPTHLRNQYLDIAECSLKQLDILCHVLADKSHSSGEINAALITGLIKKTEARETKES